MKKSNLNSKLSLLVFSLLGTTAWADSAYNCTSTLEYRIVNEVGQLEIRSIPMRVSGRASHGNGLSGEATVQAGALWSSYNSAWANVSETFIDVAGALNTGESFSLTYRGDENAYSWARYTVRTNGTYVTATNEILSTEDPNDFYPVVCEVY